MKSDQRLRRDIKFYLKKENSISQNELARRAQIGMSTLSSFLTGNHHALTNDNKKAMIKVIAPWKMDAECIRGRMKTKLYKQNFTEAEIENILLKKQSAIESSPP